MSAECTLRAVRCVCYRWLSSSPSPDLGGHPAVATDGGGPDEEGCVVDECRPWLMAEQAAVQCATAVAYARPPELTSAATA